MSGEQQLKPGEDRTWMRKGLKKLKQKVRYVLGWDCVLHLQCFSVEQTATSAPEETGRKMWPEWQRRHRGQGFA